MASYKFLHENCTKTENPLHNQTIEQQCPVLYVVQLNGKPVIHFDAICNLNVCCHQTNPSKEF